MNEAKRKAIQALNTTKSISSVLGVPPTLPGESAEEYQQGLRSVIEELEAKTVMQVYLSEKIFECLWWMRRYEQQKMMIIAREMTRLLTGVRYNQFTANEYKIMDITLDPTRRHELDKLLEKSGYTERSLMQEAFSNNVGAIEVHNNQIIILAKTLSGFQASYEVLVNRQLNIERLRLQNKCLSRDLNAIEAEALPDANQ